MPSFAPVADLQDSTGQTLDAVQAQQKLNEATGVIQGWTGQTLFAVVNDSIIVDPKPDFSIMLPELPVTAVTSLQWLDDRNGTGWNTISPSQYRFKSWGAVYIVPHSGFDPALWPTDPDTIQVTYNHGYTTIPQPVQDVCLALAARMLINPYHLQSTRTGGVQVAFSGTKNSELLDTEQIALGRFCMYGMA